MKNKILIFIVAYNAETTIDNVLSRISLDPEIFDVEILVIDDASEDTTFEQALKFKQLDSRCRFTPLRNPVNQGYGGNQKLGYTYAIDRGYEAVVLLHGDGQYAPECIHSLVEPIIKGKADAVLGSRMMKKGEALKGGMPLYKFVGNRILTGIQNFFLGTSFTEFHSGYRAYSVSALRAIPFEFNSNDFHFDTQIIIQLLAADMRILELPIPTYYGDEICHVNGIKYAFNVIFTTLAYKLHKRGIFYQLNYDIREDESLYTTKTDFFSPHFLAIDTIKGGSNVLDIGCGPFSTFAQTLKNKKSCSVYGIDVVKPKNPEVYQEFFQINLDTSQLPDQTSSMDVILLLDIIEHLKDPESFLLRLREKCRQDTEILISVPNVAFLPIRLMLLFGRFNYGKAGILDKTHIRLFTYASFRRLMKQGGFIIEKLVGIPAPFPKALGSNMVSRILLRMNRLAIFFLKRLFSYQFFARVKPLPKVRLILEKTIKCSEELK
jgi:glycosyltransferase involved in cell wall biosynthesis